MDGKLIKEGITNNHKIVIEDLKTPQGICILQLIQGASFQSTPLFLNNY